MIITETAENEAFRQELRDWLAANLTEEFNVDRAMTSDERFALRRKWQKKLYEGRWINISWPKEYGGRKATLDQQLIYNEEMMRVKSPGTANVIGLSILGPTILSVGTPEQKAKYLPDILSGDKIWCQGFSEPNAGSDVASLATTAVIDGDEFVINGQKVWTSLGWRADYAVVLCRTNPDVPKHKGLSYIIVDMKSPGVTAKPLVQMTGDAEFSEMFFDNVRAPKENLVGKLHEGWTMAIATLMHERATLSFQAAIGYEKEMQELLDLALKVKIQGKDAIEDPAVYQRLAKSYTDVHLFKLNTIRNISRLKEGTIPGPEGSLYKMQWSEMHQRMAELAMDILGEYAGLGVEAPESPDEGKWQFHYMRSRGNTIEAGTSEIQRNIVAKRVLGLPLLE
jgi:alkylation response protein AidB-like acyl-CoA dehydrogenase